LDLFNRIQRDYYRERCRLLEELVKLLELQLERAVAENRQLKATPESRRSLAKEIWG